MFVGGPGGAFGSLGGLPFILLFFVAMYFLLFAPQQRKQKQWQAMLAQIKAGDKVTTTGGLRGTVVTGQGRHHDRQGAAGRREARNREKRDCGRHDGRVGKGLVQREFSNTVVQELPQRCSMCKAGRAGWKV